MSTVLHLVSNFSDSEEDLDYVPPAELTKEDEAESSDENTKTNDKKWRKETHISRKVGKKMFEETKIETHVVDQKQKSNDLWKSFLDEVSEVKSESASGIGSAILNINKENSKLPSISSSGNTSEKFSELLFAGEIVSITNDDYVKSAVNLLSSKNVGVGETETLRKEDDLSVTPSGKRKGLVSVLNGIMNKKQKNITTLTKTLIDWKSFKKEEGIEEDIEKYNKGKGGFIERQRFLERSDLRCFEMEKTMRLSRTKKS